MTSTGFMPPLASETVNSRPRRSTTRMSPRFLTMSPSSTPDSWLLVMPGSRAVVTALDSTTAPIAAGAGGGGGGGPAASSSILLTA